MIRRLERKSNVVAVTDADQRSAGLVILHQLRWASWPWVLLHATHALSDGLQAHELVWLHTMPPGPEICLTWAVALIGIPSIAIAALAKKSFLMAVSSGRAGLPSTGIKPKTDGSVKSYPISVA